MAHTTTRQVFAGLLIGLLVGLGLILLVGGAGRAGNRNLVSQQRAVIGAAAAAQAVSDAWIAGADVQAVALALTRAVPGLEAVRVVDIDQRRLLATTDAAEAAADSLPRPLTREQKELYDRARELRAAQESNAEEGAARKPMLLAASLPDGRLDLTLPVTIDGQIAGAMLAIAAPLPVVAAGGGAGLTWLWTSAGAAVVFLLVGWRLRSRRLQVLLAALLLVAVVGLVAADGLDRLAAGRVAAEGLVRDHALAVRGAVDGVIPAPDASRWDLDRLGAPRQVFAADGALDQARIRATYAGARGRFRQAFVAFGVVALALASWVGLGWARRTWQALIHHRSAYGFVAPAMVGMVLLVFLPFIYGVVLSFTNQTLYNINQPLYEVWSGLSNYVDILSDFHIRTTTEAGTAINYQNFYWTLIFTILWTVTNVSIGVTVGLALALILNTKGLLGRPIYRVLLILPWAVPNYITALIWRGMFHQQFGVINQIIQLCGGQPINWFDGWFTSFIAVLATNSWLSFPFMMVISLGALQSIPADLYEAARVDGSSRWQQFRFVTLPSLKPALVPAVILSVIWTFNMFNIIYLVSGGQPAGATEILITDAYKIAFEQYRYGYAAAYSTIIFAILLAYGLWQNRVTQATEGI